MIEKVDIEWLSKVMLDLQPHFAPAAERQAAGHLPLYTRRGQALEADGVENRQGQQRQQQSPVDRQQRRRDVDCSNARNVPSAMPMASRIASQHNSRRDGFTIVAPALDRAVA